MSRGAARRMIRIFIGLLLIVATTPALAQALGGPLPPGSSFIPDPSGGPGAGYWKIPNPNGLYSYIYQAGAPNCQKTEGYDFSQNPACIANNVHRGSAQRNAGAASTSSGIRYGLVCVNRDSEGNPIDVDGRSIADWVTVSIPDNVGSGYQLTDIRTFGSGYFRFASGSVSGSGNERYFQLTSVIDTQGNRHTVYYNMRLKTVPPSRRGVCRPPGTRVRQAPPAGTSTYGPYPGARNF